MAAASGSGETEPVQQSQGCQLAEPELAGAAGVKQHAVDLVGGEDPMVVEELEQQAVPTGDVGIDAQQARRA
ncbi:hypothetical protein [Micromonospora echinaurantiaca]|uniref:hypothetical protein n=1 Tax=Micromonospora echinaurantiaca TaxID=47857 RepID=UPI0034458076